MSLVVVVVLAGTLAGPRTACADVSYIYDALGRLVAVVDSASNQAAIYSYDAVGNLLSIARQSASVVSIIEFNPKSGPVGTTVTIHGTGFSPTPELNAVTFGGTAATVSSASATELIATVPAGATTGPIAVTTPGGSATTSSAFVVETSGVPTITSFTPTIGTPGTSVSISGTNFEIVPQYNHVRFNDVAYALVDSATPSTISASVPGGTGSGRLSVTTPAGSAVSAADFFVPPSPYTAADVEVTGRMAVGGVQTVTFASSNKVGLVVFDANVGQRVSLGLTSVTIGSGCCTFYLRSLNPDGTVLTSTLLGTAGGVVELPVFARTGTYTIFVDPETTNTGSVTMTMSTELTGTLAVDGASHNLNIPRPGQNARLTFGGTAGQRLSLAMTDVTMYQANVSVLKPDGTELLAPTLVNNGSRVLDLPVLPVSGAYSVFVDPYNLNTGSMTLLLSAEVTGGVTIDGAAYALSVTRPGQNARLSFSGTAGQRVSLALTGVTIPCCSATASILKPDGTTLSSTGFATAGAVIDAPALPTTGTYAIFIDPGLATVGDATLTLSSEQAGTLAIDGSSYGVSLTRPGQNSRITFDGTMGQRVSLGMTGATFTGPVNISVLTPSGTTLAAPAAPFFSGGAAVRDFPVLPETGTYTLFIDPSGVVTGSVTVMLSAEITGSIVIDGAAYALSVARPGQNARLNFSGTAGQRVSLALTGVTIPCCSATASVLKPDGTTLSSTGFATTGAVIDAPALPTTGTYAIFIDPGLATVGNVTLTLSQELSGALVVDGAGVTLTNRVGQNARLTFDGTGGQQVSVRLTGNSMSSVTVRLLGPDDTSITSASSASSSFNLATQTLPTAGTYSVTIDPFSLNTGSITVAVTSP